MTSASDLLELLADPDAQATIEPPGEGEGYWAGGPSGAWRDEVFYLAYRLRRPVTEGRGYANVVARSDDGIHFETVATITSKQFDCASLERPSLVPLADGGWRMYVSCSTENSKHWRVETIEAADLADLAEGNRTVVLPGAEAVVAWKDPVVLRHGDQWHMWACRHPLDGGDDEADRMTSVYFESDDGLIWNEVGTALRPTPNTWNARGTRITTVVHNGDEWIAFYDGRASAAENWFERTGIAFGTSPAEFQAALGPTPERRTVRYASLVESPSGLRLYWEASRPDGANEVRTAVVPRPLSLSQS